MRSRLLLAVAMATCVLTTPAAATRIKHRTLEADRNGSSLRPVIADDGRFLVFDSEATNVSADRNGRYRDVFQRDLKKNTLRLVSTSIFGRAGNGSSIAPATSANGVVVAFESTASNLVKDDINLRRDVFAGVGRFGIVAVSVSPSGATGRGRSSEADVSSSGALVAFTSNAPNLVRGDRNGESDVFVRDLATSKTILVSRGLRGRPANGPSSAPAISPDGRYVAFFSEADNLVRGDRRDLPDVFLADTSTGRVQRVSVSSGGQEQNESVEPPFVQIADVSRGGRFVVFDSDATNLVRNDARDHTDVFLRDVRKRETTRVSAALDGEANSDSVYPRISPNGRFITFQSFASNLFIVDADGPNSFLFDRRLKLNSILDVTDRGKARRAVTKGHILQRPSVSADGNTTAFTSGARLSTADTGGLPDAYVRRVDPPEARVQVRDTDQRYRIRTDDPRADVLICRIKQFRLLCPPSGSLDFVAPGRYRFFVRPWGAGMRPGRKTSTVFHRPPVSPAAAGAAQRRAGRGADRADGVSVEPPTAGEDGAVGAVGARSGAQQGAWPLLASEFELADLGWIGAWPGGRLDADTGGAGVEAGETSTVTGRVARGGVDG